jgi:hypothetical protein
MARIWTRAHAITTGNASLAAEAIRMQNGWTIAAGAPMLRPPRD